MKKKTKNLLWYATMDDYLEIIKLAIKNGKQSGDSMEEEFFQVMKKKKPFASTNKDIDLLTGDLREKGIKVLNMNELKRRKKNGQA